jgi:starch synthase (maltosyl-transferring)
MPNREGTRPDGRNRVVIEGVRPEVNCGYFPTKDTVGDTVVIEADVFADGHDALSARLYWRHESEPEWRQVGMRPLVNDRWRGSFKAERQGLYFFTLDGWVDHFKTWQRDLRKRVAAEQEVGVDLLIGAELVAKALPNATGEGRARLEHWRGILRGHPDRGVQQEIAESRELADLMDRYAPRPFLTKYRDLSIRVDRERARFSSWYELFPRSTAPEPGRHGTFNDVIARLPYVASMGFDVLYLPPIHPIGRQFRKGPNNNPTAGDADPGSPWAIGSPEGGHKAIHPELGTLEDFRRLVEEAQGHGMEIALDIAFQCAPDHPYVREHPEWFRSRPDGTIQYAENPPKKYQDIYPFDFETENWKELWEELKSIFVYWIEQGVKIFRVDNPHTKPLPFWGSCIAALKQRYPDVLFLSEAFTRPKIMYALAKLGFTQSYTYFAWRNTKRELIEYLTEVTTSPVADFFRPNLWPNTPDILTEELQLGGRPVFMSRVVLAATLGASYGIYGPAFELCENQPREHKSEEYLDSEKYQIRWRDLDQPHSLRDFIARVNRIRRENPALQRNRSLRFHPVDNEQIIAYSKRSEDGANVILVVVNLDPVWAQSGWVEIPIEEFGLEEHHPYQVHDLLTDGRYMWRGRRNFVKINPHAGPAHIFRLQPHLRTERDFDTY